MRSKTVSTKVIHLNIHILFFKMQAFNLAGASPFTNVTSQTTNPLPPVTSVEVSEEQIIRRLEEKTKEEKNDYVVKYLILGGVLAGCLIVLVLICTLFNFCQRRKRKTAAIKSSAACMSEIQDKYADTAVQISNHQSFSNLDPLSRSTAAVSGGSVVVPSLQQASTVRSPHPHSQSLTKDIGCSQFEMTLLPDPGGGISSNSNIRHHSISDSMFSFGHNSAELNSLGHEEYNDEPSRQSWRRSRRSEESFI